MANDYFSKEMFILKMAAQSALQSKIFYKYQQRPFMMSVLLVSSSLAQPAYIAPVILAQLSPKMHRESLCTPTLTLLQSGSIHEAKIMY